MYFYFLNWDFSRPSLSALLLTNNRIHVRLKQAMEATARIICVKQQ